MVEKRMKSYNIMFVLTFNEKCRMILLSVEFLILQITSPLFVYITSRLTFLNGFGKTLLEKNKEV